MPRFCSVPNIGLPKSPNEVGIICGCGPVLLSDTPSPWIIHDDVPCGLQWPRPPSLLTGFSQKTYRPPRFRPAETIETYALGGTIGCTFILADCHEAQVKPTALSNPTPIPQLDWVLNPTVMSSPSLRLSSKHNHNLHFADIPCLAIFIAKC